MWFLMGATSWNVGFSGGHILECGFLVGATSCHVVFSGDHILKCVFLVGATFCHVVFSGGHILGNGFPPRSATSLLQTTILVIKFNVARSCFDSWFYQV